MKLFLATGFSKKTFENFDEMDIGPVLISFAYIPDIIKDKWTEDWLISKNKERNLLIDSGAFTFINASKKVIDWDDFTDKYIAFINKYKIKYYVELDIDVIVGYKKVLEFREKLERLTWEGAEIIPVWHTWRGKDDFIETVKKYHYIAFGAVITEGISLKTNRKFFNNFADLAHKHGCKIHCLGFTGSDLKNYRFDSVDSSSWTAASRYGQLQLFNTEGKKMTSFDRKKIPASKKIDGKKATILSIREWGKFQKFAQKLNIWKTNRK